VNVWEKYTKNINNHVPKLTGRPNNEDMIETGPIQTMNLSNLNYSNNEPERASLIHPT
jgi:hypothetical protein